MSINEDKQLQEKWYQWTVDKLASRGVELNDLRQLVHILQDKYIENLSDEMIDEAIYKVLHKREVQNAIMVGIEQDELAEQGKLSHPYQEIMERDEGLFGIDEALAVSITNCFGTIGLTNFGYVDKIKPQILKWLNDKKTGFINVYLDDLVGGIATAAAAKLAHANIDSKSVYDTDKYLSQINLTKKRHSYTNQDGSKWSK